MPKLEKVLLADKTGDSLQKSIAESIIWFANLPQNREQSKRQEKERQTYQRKLGRIISRRYKARKRKLLSTLSQSQWENTLLAFDYKCVYCNKSKWEHQDHLMPVALGGEYTKENIVPACAKCNRSKSAMHPADWIEEDKLKWIMAKIGCNQLPTVAIKI